MTANSKIQNRCEDLIMSPTQFIYKLVRTAAIVVIRKVVAPTVVRLTMNNAMTGSFDRCLFSER